MGRRHYRQYCGLARALDELGERWTLLVVRDLLPGPLRYSDLRDGLPGISTDVLAERLRTLQSAGIVERATLPPPAASAVYRLTDAGQELRPIIHRLGEWGGRFLESPAETTDRIDPAWALETLTAGYSGPADRQITASFDFEGRVFTVDVARGVARLRRGAAAGADVTVAGPTRLLLGVATGALALDDEDVRARISLEGDEDGLRMLLGALPPIPRAADPA